MDIKPTLSARHVRRAFGTGAGVTVPLRDASLDLRAGQVTLLMGPSGSGKTTLLAVVSGLLRPDGGQVLALGQDLWRLPEGKREEFRLRHCGFIFQGCNLFPALTAWQQLEMVLCWGLGQTAAAARPRVAQMLDLLGLADVAQRRPQELSGGEQQRVAIGRALIKEPAFCFADEPTSALDWERGAQVVELLREAAHARGTTVLVVAHDPRLIARADRVVKLEEGVVVDHRVRRRRRTERCMS
jgi:putative ABC transport system ATP-binding protein